MKIADIPRFSSVNNMSINVLTYEDDEFRPLLVADQIKDQHVNLLYLRNEDTDVGDTRY